MVGLKQKNAAVKRQFGFAAYGVSINVESDKEWFINELERRVGEILPNGVERVEPSAAEIFLEIKADETGRFSIYKNEESVANKINEENLFDLMESQIRLAVAERAVGKVFLHAGAIGWKGRAVIFPASSFSGKSSLVAALIKRGAEYYSDEYAVLDENGLVEPFPKSLSLRGIIDDYQQVERRAETLGGATGKTPLPVGLALICTFDKRVKNRFAFEPEILSRGRGTLEILAHAIPVRYNPKFALEILNKVSSRAIIAKCKRGEAEIFAKLLIEHLDTIF